MMAARRGPRQKQQKNDTVRAKVEKCGKFDIFVFASSQRIHEYGTRMKFRYFQLAINPKFISIIALILR